MRGQYSRIVSMSILFLVGAVTHGNGLARL